MNREMMMSDTVEKYLRGEMLPEEKRHFEELRRTNPEIDQLVVEHKLLLEELSRYGEREAFRSGLRKIHQELHQTGQITEETPTGIVRFMRKYRRVVALAASIAGITAITISGLISYFTPKSSVSEIKQLSQQLIEVRNSQKQTLNEINRLKTTSPNAPTAPGKLGGTGFMIDARGYLATSAHIVNSADSVYVENGRGVYFKATPIYVNNNTDVAILKIVDERFQPSKYLPYNIRKGPAELGEQIFTLGYPRSEIVYNAGYLSAGTGYNGDSSAYQIAISANPGNSGGPIFNDAGEVIGILSGKQTTAEGVVFSSKSINIYEALKEIKADEENDNQVKITTVLSAVKGLDRVHQIKKLRNWVYVVKSY